MEPYRSSLDLEAMTPEARDVIERTERMLTDLDCRAGPFAGLSYVPAPAILDHPFLTDVGLSLAEIWNTLELERLSNICGYPVSAEHVDRYAHIREAAGLWRERTDFQMAITPSSVGGFPLVKQQIGHLRTLLSNCGMVGVKSYSSGGYSTVDFRFPAVYFGEMSGHIDVKTNHAGETRFVITSGAILSGDAVLTARDGELLGTKHYHRFGLTPPEGSDFRMLRDEPTGKLDHVVALIAAVASYYRTA